MDVVCTIVDVTERQRTETLLRGGAAKLSGMLVRGQDTHSLLQKACMNLCDMREGGVIIGVWLKIGGEEIAPFALSDDDYQHLSSDRSAETSSGRPTRRRRLFPGILRESGGN